ncbi:MAG: beta strand repeat-containing protein, partial [Achromobacter sp.]
EVEQGAIDALIEQGGAIRADGGVVYLTAKAAGDLASTVINHTGITQAKTLATGENGKIVLLGDMVNDRIAVAGKLDASAPSGGKGGFVETSAAKVTVAAGAVITTKAVSGQHGSWLIDPTDFTVSAGTTGQTDSGIGADTLSASLDNGNVELRTVDNGSQAGNINVNSGVKWSASTKLTLSAHGAVTINAPITATGDAAGLELNLGGFKQRGFSSTGDTYTVNAPVTLSGANASLTINGANYTLIQNMDQFKAINSAGLTGRYALGQDLDASAQAYTRSLINAGFNGVLAGMGHTISNVTINAPSNVAMIGLISTIGGNGVIRDLGLKNVSVTGGTRVGALVGDNQGGQIINSYAQGVVNGGATAGGLVGASSGSITNSHADVKVTTTSGYSGGLVGNNSGDISNSYATGDVSGGAGSYFGGLVGYVSAGNLTDVYATGNVTTGGNSAGGLVGGSLASMIKNAYATGDVTATFNVGGLIGYGYGVTIDSVHATGKLTSTTNQTSIGGIGGYLRFASSVTNAVWDSASTGVSVAVGTSAEGTTVAPTTTSVTATNNYSRSAYANYGTWTLVPGTQDVYVAKDASGNAKWIMIEGQTRPFLASEYSLAVSNEHQLQLMSYDLNASYNIVRDIDAKATGTVGGGMWGSGGFSPIGTGAQFTGSLDGQGHVISNLTAGINASFAGLFGLIGETGMVRSVGLDNAVVGGFFQSGALAAVNYGTIDNVFANAKVSTQGLGNGVGGLVGQNSGTISNAYSSGMVSINGPLIGQVGGLVGHNIGTINKSYSTSKINTLIPVPGNGALVGMNSGVVNDSFAASTDAAGNPASVMPLQLIGANGGTVNATSGMKTYAELTQLSTFKDAGWDIDNAGGTGATWRIYDGAGGPLLRGFLKQVTVSLADKVYDGQVSGGVGYIASRPDAELGGSISYTANSKNAGTYSAADGSLTVNGGLYSNQQGYDIIYADGLSLNVLKRGVTLDVTADNKTYDGNTSAVVRGQAGSGLISGDNLGALGIGSFSDKNAGVDKTVTVGGITLNGTDAGNYFISSITSITPKATISAKELTGTIVASGKTYDGTLTAGTNGALVGKVAGDDVALSTTGAFADKNAGLGKLVNVSGSLAGEDAGNYVLSANTTATADIAVRQLNGTLGALDKVYDGNVLASVTGAGSLDVLGGDVLSVTGTFANKNAGNGKTVVYVLGGADANNYALGNGVIKRLASITPATLTGALGALDKIYDGNTAAAVTGANTINGLIEGDSLGVAGTFADKNAGEHKAVAFSLTGEDAGNYVLSVAGARANIKQRVLGIVGSTVAGKTYDGSASAQAFAGSLTNLVEGEALGVGTSAQFDNANAGSRNANVHYTLIDTGSGLAANYVLADTQHQAVIDRRAITVVAEDKAKRLGEADPALTWRIAQGNLIGNDSLAGALSRAAGESAGRYAISANGLFNSNYRIATQDGTLVVSNAVQPPDTPVVGSPVPPDNRRASAQSAAQWLQAAVGTANSIPPNLTSDLSYVPVNSSSQGQDQPSTTQPAPNSGQGARAMQGPAQVLVIDGGIRLPEGVVQGGI